MIALLNYGKLYQDAIEAKRLEDSFYEFVKAAWPHFDPADFCGNWHLEDACRHLEEVARGHINRLLINVPPRTAKSSIASICFVPWVWAQRVSGPLLGPKVSFFYASYAEELALDHSLKARRLIESKWYQKLWGGRFKLVSDRNKVGHFENDKGGYRMSSSVSARSTGWGASVICLPPGEKVLTELGWLKIDDIVRERQPVRLAGYDHANEKLVWQNILKYEQNPGGKLVRIRFAGRSFRCTADHPVFIEGRGYVRADSVKVGEVLWTVPREDLRPAQVVRAIVQAVEPASFTKTTYNLNVTPCHNYFVGGALVHNCADDPHLVREAESDAVREDVIKWWSESMPSRLNDRRTGAMVVIMQRVHEGDVAGHVLASDMGYVHFCVPMCYVPCKHVNAWNEEGKIQTYIGDDIDDIDPANVFWADRRIQDGELLWPDRYPASEVSKLEVELGPYAFCTPAESPVLMADLSLHPIADVKVGDQVVGFRTGTNDKRAKHEVTTVRAISKSVRPVVKMVLDSGQIVRCTADHKWFTGRNDASHSPYKAAKVGSPLRRVCAPSLPVLAPENERLAGWVSGFFDGEGSVSLMHRRAGEGSVLIAFHQTAEKNLPLCEKLEHALNELGFNYTIHARYPTTISSAGTPWQERRAYYLKSDAGSGVHKNGPSLRASKLILNQRFIHIVQPTKWRDRIIHTTVNGRMFTTTERVVSIEPDGVETVYGLTTDTGNYVVWGLASSNSGQYQQDPAPRGGGIIRREWWKQYDDEDGAEFGAKPGQYPPCEYILASLDTAYTEKEENDPSALSIWGIFRDKVGNPQVILMVCWAERMMVHDLVVRVGADCKKFKVDRLIIEDKAAGHSVSQEISRLFGNFDFGIELVNPRTGFIKSPDKVARLQTVVHMFAEGLIWAPDKTWADEMIKQCALVPRAIHDDLADTCSQALIYLRRAGWIVKKDERALEIEDETRYRPKFQPLYPA